MPVPHLLLLAVLFASLGNRAAETNQYLEFVRAQAAALRHDEAEPGRSWGGTRHAARMRKELLDAMGGWPKTTAPLDPRMLGGFERDLYRVEKLIFQTFPGVWMTANAYVPNRPGRLPALLMVHGHWRGAKQDPVVQARCIGAAKLGFFVLAVDAFGAGERAIGKALGEYHGEMTAATLLPTGLTLAGVQAYENKRAVDYLSTRPEVDPNAIGITGASGGGNQSMYAGALDTRLQAVAPVCSVGNYQAYLGAACCYCELAPGALAFTEEWGVLGLIAPRALMVISATRDARQFSVAEAAWSLARVDRIYDSWQGALRTNHLRHVTFESGHDYSQPMREAVYGWMRAHLLKEGAGSPLSEPPIATEDPEVLRCFPGDTRPDDWITLPKFAAAQARNVLEKRPQSPDGRTWTLEKERRKRLLREELLGGFPKKSPLNLQILPTATGRTVAFSPEPGLRLEAHQEGTNRSQLLLVLDLENGRHASTNAMARVAVEAGWSIVTLDLRATGGLAWPSDKIGRAPDHTTAQWAFWIGRPLIGQWAWDIRRLLDAIEEADGRLPNRIAITGTGPAGLVALAAAALDARIDAIGAIGTLATYVSEAPYEGQRMGTIIPGLLRDLGDVSDLAALIAPRRLCLQAAAGPQNQLLHEQPLAEQFTAAKRAYTILQQQHRMQLSAETNHAAMLGFLSAR